MKNLYLLLFTICSSFLWAQNCDTDAFAQSDNSVFCCHDLVLTNNSTATFFDLRITPQSSFDLANVQFMPGWAFSVNNASEVVFFPVGGPIPTGTFTPLSYCIENQDSAPQILLVEWIDESGESCSNLVEMNCARCIDISNSELVCDAGGYRFDFDFTNVNSIDIYKIEVDFVNPTPISVTPSFIDLSGSPVSPGNTSAGHSFLFDLPVNSGILEFTIRSYGQFDCCQCISDTIRIEIPDCCIDPCQDVYVEIVPDNPIEEYCCWTLDLFNVCDPDFFSGIEVSVPSNIQFASQTSSSDWYLVPTPTPQSAIFKPRFTTSIPVGNSFGKINFCLSGVDDPADIPQLITISWLDNTDQVACDTIIETDCPVLVPGDCVIVLEDTIYCTDSDPNVYQFDWSLENVGNFTATNIYINGIRTIPTGGTVSMSPTTITGLNFRPGDLLVMPSATITGLNPGDQFCYQVTITDDIVSGSQNCCHTQELCFFVPECGEPCLDPCAGTSYVVNPTEDQEDYCCYELEVGVECDTTFIGIKLEALNGVIFSHIAAPNVYGITDLSSSVKIIKPRFTTPGFPFIKPNNNIVGIDFCLGGVNDPSQQPQQVVIHWLDINGETICTDTIIFECEITPPGDCVIVLNDTIKCEPPGHYTYCFDVRNVGQFDGKYIKVGNLHSNPVGGVYNPAMICDTFNLPIGTTRTLPPIHINGSGPGDEFCYTISIYDDPDPATGYNECCHTDTLCVILPDCGDTEICDQVSFDTLSNSGDCCFTLEIDNQYSGTYFEALRIEALTAGVLIPTATTYPNWVVTPYGTGYEITYTGTGAPFIPLGVSIPMDFCVSGFTTNVQTIELTWLKSNNDGDLIVECCQAIVLRCEPPGPDIPCFEISEMESTCEVVNGQNQLKLNFKLMNNTNIGATFPGYNINRLTFNVITPSGGSINQLTLVPILAPGAMDYYSVDLIGITPGQNVHFTAGVHLVNEERIECCVSDSTYCFTAAECKKNPKDPCINKPDEILYEGWAVVTCGPMANFNGTPISPTYMDEHVLGRIDTRLHHTAPRDAHWAGVPMHNGSTGSNKQWDYRTLGKIFGLAVDYKRGYVYTSATDLYDISAISYGIAGRPAIYKVDLNTDIVTPVIITNNTNLSDGPSYTAHIPNEINVLNGRAPGFGNLAYNYTDDVLYASNLEDGVIYAIDPSTNTILGGYDPWSPDSGTNGEEIRGELVYGVQFHAGDRKLYFAKSSPEHRNNIDAAQFQQIWSVNLLSSGLIDIGSSIMVFDLPDYFGTAGYSEPVTDIAFSSSGHTMLLSEKGVVQPPNSMGQRGKTAHSSRLLKYNRVNSSSPWVVSPTNTYGIGASGNNSAGGCDFTYDMSNPDDVVCDTIALCTGNALRFRSPDSVYGLQGLPLAGGDNSNSFLVDFDNVISSCCEVKFDLGDVEVIRDMCCKALLPTAVSDHPAIEWNMYPNPASHGVIISGDDNRLIRDIQITSISGKSIRSIKIDNYINDYNIDITDLTSGIYMIQLRAQDGTTDVKKLVVTK